MHLPEHRASVPPSRADHVASHGHTVTTPQQFAESPRVRVQVLVGPSGTEDIKDEARWKRRYGAAARRLARTDSNHSGKLVSFGAALR